MHDRLENRLENRLANGLSQVLWKALFIYFSSVPYKWNIWHKLYLVGESTNRILNWCFTGISIYITSIKVLVQKQSAKSTSVKLLSTFPLMVSIVAALLTAIFIAYSHQFLDVTMPQYCAHASNLY